MLCSSQTGKRKNMNESRDCEYATHLGILEEVVLAVDLRELECRAGAESLLLGQPVYLSLSWNFFRLDPSTMIEWLLVVLVLVLVLMCRVGVVRTIPPRAAKPKNEQIGWRMAGRKHRVLSSVSRAAHNLLGSPFLIFELEPPATMAKKKSKQKKQASASADDDDDWDALLEVAPAADGPKEEAAADPDPKEAEAAAPAPAPAAGTDAAAAFLASMGGGDDGRDGGAAAKKKKKKKKKGGGGGGGGDEKKDEKVRVHYCHAFTLRVRPRILGSCVCVHHLLHSK